MPQTKQYAKSIATTSAENPTKPIQQATGGLYSCVSFDKKIYAIHPHHSKNHIGHP